MSGLVATPQISATEDQITIPSDGWFPPVKLAEVREALNLDGGITTTRLRRAILWGISRVNSELREWKQTQVQASGAGSLIATTNETIDDKNVRAEQYFRAVCGYVEAQILESNRGYDLTAEGARRAEALQPRIDEARRNAYWSIQEILGEPHNSSALV